MCSQGSAYPGKNILYGMVKSPQYYSLQYIVLFSMVKCYHGEEDNIVALCNRRELQYCKKTVLHNSPPGVSW